jgi:amidohydrolase
LSQVPSKADLKRAVCEEIDRRAEWIRQISDHVMRHPETGFREIETASYISARLDELGIVTEHGLAVTGVKGRLRGRGDGPTVAILGELDSLMLEAHPLADPVTHAAHACGHNAQLAAMVGAATGLKDVMPYLDGDVVVFATPAEECIETEWRRTLQREGTIEFLVGKPELIRIGAFDDVDMAMLTHTPHSTKYLASVGDSHNGCLIKNARFAGRAAHAGASPWLGTNALKAATLAFAAIDAHRETFREEDLVRVHGIITKGGDAVSAVPADVRVELLVRARTVDALKAVSALVDSSLRGGALALGAGVTIETSCAYLPHEPDPNLTRLVHGNAVDLLGARNVGNGRHVSGSTDLGDLSFVMPVVHPRSAGTEGAPHQTDYWVRDHDLAAVNPAKVMACTVVDLLHDDAREARNVLAEAPEKLTVDEYLALRRSLEALVVDGDVVGEGTAASEPRVLRA